MIKTPAASMADFYTHDDYRAIIRAYLKPAEGMSRGTLQKLAKSAKIHLSTLSQVLRGNRSLTSEQGLAICESIGFSDGETGFFIDLLNLDRAGTPSLRRYYEQRITERRTRETQLVNVLPHAKKLPESSHATFYSHWFYSAVRILSAIPEYDTLDRIERRFRIPRAELVRVVSFLVQEGLCVKNGNRLSAGARSTHLEATSPYAPRNHANWRLRAMERHPFLEHDREIAYTSPMGLSKADAIRIRARLVEEIRKVCEVVDRSEPEAAYCLNIDWFEF